MEKTELTEEVKEVMRENAMALIAVLLDEEVPFNLVLWNKNNWDKPLPEDIMKKFPLQIPLDVKEQTLEDSYFEEGIGVVINTFFHGKEYSKVLQEEEILGILDLAGHPLQLNNFKPEIEEKVKKEIGTKKELLSSLVAEGITEEGANNSINMFLKNNPDLKKMFK